MQFVTNACVDLIAKALSSKDALRKILEHFSQPEDKPAFIDLRFKCLIQQVQATLACFFDKKEVEEKAAIKILLAVAPLLIDQGAGWQSGQFQNLALAKPIQKDGQEVHEIDCENLIRLFGILSSAEELHKQSIDTFMAVYEAARHELKPYCDAKDESKIRFPSRLLDIMSDGLRHSVIHSIFDMMNQIIVDERKKTPIFDPILLLEAMAKFHKE